MFNSVKVKNLNGTSMREPKGFKSWKDFWKHHTKDVFILCSNQDCAKVAEVGAHVKKAEPGSSGEWYIVPLCKGCNKLTDEFYVSEFDLVPVNK